MTSRTIVITGASDGIGAAAARRLSRNGDKVVVVGRSQSKTIAVAEELGADYFVADFADLSQVRALAEKIRCEYPRIDVLANNAGGLVSKPQVSADGLEKTYQVNYLAPFLLTTELLDVLVESRATVLPSGLSVATFHPGNVNSNIGEASGSRFLVFMQRHTPAVLLTSTPDEGADQLVWLASSTPGVEWTSGEYYSKRRIAKSSRLADDPGLARELWDRTLAKIGSS
jgi:hypothetical protein